MNSKPTTPEPEETIRFYALPPEKMEDFVGAIREAFADRPFTVKLLLSFLDRFLQKIVEEKKKNEPDEPEKKEAAATEDSETGTLIEGIQKHNREMKKKSNIPNYSEIEEYLSFYGFSPVYPAQFNNGVYWDKKNKASESPIVRVFLRDTGKFNNEDWIKLQRHFDCGLAELWSRMKKHAKETKGGGAERITIDDLTIYNTAEFLTQRGWHPEQKNLDHFEFFQPANSWLEIPKELKFVVSRESLYVVDVKNGGDSEYAMKVVEWLKGIYGTNPEVNPAPQPLTGEDVLGFLTSDRFGFRYAPIGENFVKIYNRGVAESLVINRKKEISPKTWRKIKAFCGIFEIYPGEMLNNPEEPRYIENKRGK